MVRFGKDSLRIGSRWRIPGGLSVVVGIGREKEAHDEVTYVVAKEVGIVRLGLLVIGNDVDNIVVHVTNVGGDDVNDSRPLFIILMPVSRIDHLTESIVAVHTYTMEQVTGRVETGHAVRGVFL